jgi:hypothetical protein
MGSNNGKYNLVLWTKRTVLHKRGHNPNHQVVWKTIFFTVAPNIFAPLCRAFFTSIFVALRILRRLHDFSFYFFLICLPLGIRNDKHKVNDIRFSVNTTLCYKQEGRESIPVGVIASFH